MKALTERILRALSTPRDDGYSTETVIITAVLIGIALAVGAGINTAVGDWISQLGTGLG